MEKRLSFWMIILLIPIILFSTIILTNNLFNISLKHDVKNIQIMEELIANDVKSKFKGEIRYDEIVSLSQKYSKQYTRQGVQLNFAYLGKYFNAELVEPHLKSMNIGSRAAMLYTKGITPQYIIANPITNALTMYTIQDFSELYSQKNQMYTIAMYVAIVACIIIIIIAYILAKKISSPVKQLTKAANALAMGDNTAKIPSNAKYEIGELGKAFNIMQKAVSDREASLKFELDNKEYLLSALSHEMRTPLTCILGNTRLLQTAQLDSDSQADLYNGIIDQVNRLRDMEKQLMLLVDNSQNDFKVENINIIELLNNVKNALIEQSAGVNIIVEGDNYSIKANYALLYTMANNLLANAIYASETGKTIKLVSNPDGFSVEDEGIGMSEDQLIRAFDPFYKVDKARTRNHGGVGLGLSICRRIAELHGGNLLINSNINQGTKISYVQ